MRLASLPLLLATMPFIAPTASRYIVPSSTPPVVTVRASEFAFDAPKSIQAGTTTFHLVNTGKEMHHLTIVSLPKGKSMGDYVAAMKAAGRPPAWATEMGGPNPATPGGGTADATVTLEPGNYVLTCMIPSPGAPVIHLAKGMMAPLTVLPSRGTGSAPTPDVTVRLTDYAFELSKPLTAGHHVIGVTNDAVQPHEIVLLKLPPGKSAADMGSYVDKGMMGPPPAMPVGGMAALAHGRTGSFPVDLTAGHYGVICFVPDAKDGKPHYHHGMVKDITVLAQ